MIKILSVLLLAANLGLYLLIQQQAAEQQRQRITPGGNIVLLSERAAPSAGYPTDSTKASENAPAEDPHAEIHCYSYGPLDSQLAAVGVMARIKEIADTARIRSVDAGPQFWLIVDTDAPTKSQAQQSHHAYASIIQGELKGRQLYQIGIDAKLAEQSRQRHQQQGPALELKQMSTDKPLYWVDFVSNQARIDPRELGLLSQQRLLIKAGYCPGPDEPHSMQSPVQKLSR